MRARSGVDVDAVTSLVEHVAATVVAPRFRDLQAGEIREKSPGDLVTVVDTEAEAALIRGLEEISPGTPVVGEEGTAAEPDRLRILAGAPRAWVVDPLDGTQAFVEGSPDHAVMVGLVEDGEAVAGWICLPAHGRTYVAERGSGARVNGAPLSRPAPSRDPEQMRGGLASWAIAPGVRDRFAELRPFGDRVSMNGRLWSGYEYSRLASGEQDFLVYWRTWPWDHAPGAVIVREVGGVSRRLDGTDYRPDGTDHGANGALGAREGLIAAADPQTFALVREALRTAR